MMLIYVKPLDSTPAQARRPVPPAPQQTKKKTHNKAHEGPHQLLPLVLVSPTTWILHKDLTGIPIFNPMSWTATHTPRTQEIPQIQRTSEV